MSSRGFISTGQQKEQKALVMVRGLSNVANNPLKKLTVNLLKTKKEQ